MDASGVEVAGPIPGKRAFDILVALLLLALTAPCIAATAVALKIASPGPVLYRANRVGRGGKIFTMHKFRTMHVGAQNAGPAITGPGDPRIFAFGELLRRTKIDELPQLVDVLRGKMSIVGPRPEDPQIVEDHYTPRQMQTLRVRPGMTSPAAIYFSTQADIRMKDGDVISSYVENVLREKLEMEIDYIETASLRADLKIVWDSFLYVLKAMSGQTPRSDRHDRS